MTEAVGSSKTTVHIYQTTRRHIPEDIAVRVHPRTSLTTHTTIKVFSED